LTERIGKLVKKVLGDLAALPEERMRLELLGRALADLEATDVARFIDAVYRSPSGSSLKVRAALVNPEWLMDSLGPVKYRATYMAALGLGLARVSRLFTDLPPHRRGVAGYDKEEEVRMEHTSLGERRTLSKTNVKDTLDRLLSDPDPVVIGNLLNNPRITEKEVLKFASKRPASPEILKLLAVHKKWSRRYSVRRAIAFNPYSPPRTAIALLEFLLAQDLRSMSTDKTLHPQVRLSAKEALEERTGDGG
jgi:hypothetical protein